MALPRYAVRRLVQVVPVLFGVVTVTFVLSNAVPGDPVQTMLGPSPSQAQVAAIRARYGLDRPLLVRYVDYVAGVLRGDLGRSIYYDVPVSLKIVERLPATLLLLGSSFAFAVSTAVPLGVVSASRRNRPTDHVARVASLVGVSTPSFWTGLVFVLLFSYHLDVLPATGLVMPWADPAVHGVASRVQVVSLAAVHLLGPTLALGTLQLAAITRIQRSSMLEVLTEDYVRLARAYGVPERVVLRKHAFWNAQLPVLTVLGLQSSSAMGGAVLVEAVFEIEGLGGLILTAVANRDYPLIMGTTILFSLVFLVGVVLTDLAYAAVDPRISYETGERP